MNPSFEAFADEMVKIAFLKRLAKGFTNALSEGWHGVGPEGSMTRNTWFGRGADIKPSFDQNRWGGSHAPVDPRSIAAGHRYRPTAGTRAWEQVSSLGGLTKALPVGAKSMMAIPTALMAAQALKGHDPSGQERTRSERVTGLAANTVGGLVGSSLAMKALKGRGGLLGAMAAPMVGGMLGGSLAEKATTAPFRAARAARHVSTPPLSPQVPQAVPEGAPQV
jgi:hypothetical protein